VLDAVIVAETVSDRFELRERADIGLFLRRIHPHRRSQDPQLSLAIF
jgi:hypothetical protein